MIAIKWASAHQFAVRSPEMVMPDWYAAADTPVKVALIAALVSMATSLLTIAHSLFGAPLKYWLEKKALRNKLATEYEYDQRKSLRTLISKYQGRMIEAAEVLNHRMWNLYKNEGKGWLDRQGNYEDAQYYFKSWAYRFINFLAMARLFEKEAIFIDSRIAEKTDLAFIKYMKAFGWATCDVALFSGVTYDDSRQKDHFFRDDLRRVCDACCKDGSFPDQEAIDRLLKSSDYQFIYRFFDGLKKEEGRLRWDRLVVLDLLIMAFLNSFGYDIQQSSQEDFKTVVKHVKHGKILRNLDGWLSKLGLEKEPSAKLIRVEIESRLANVQSTA
jgi:hypothetical protein